MSTNTSALRSTAGKRNELNRKTIRGATHEVGIFIGLLFAADKVDKVVDILSRPPAEKIVLVIAALVFIYLVVVRAADLTETLKLVKELGDEAGDNGGD